MYIYIYYIHAQQSKIVAIHTYINTRKGMKISLLSFYQVILQKQNSRFQWFLPLIFSLLPDNGIYKLPI